MAHKLHNLSGDVIGLHTHEQSREGNPLFDTKVVTPQPSITEHALLKERRRLIRKKDLLIAKFPTFVESIDKEIDKIDGDIISIKKKELDELISNRELHL